MHGEVRHDRTLRRIVAMLAAFADLADRAASCCQPVRFLLLLVLRHAETIAREVVADAMRVDGLWFDDGMEGTSSPEDAALLAERFRLLAEELVGLLPPVLRYGAPLPRHDAGPTRASASRAEPPAASACLPGCAPSPFDTS